MNIVKRKDGRWQGVVELPSVNGKRARKFIYAPTRQECKILVNEFMENMRTNNLCSNTKLLFSNYAERWFKDECHNLSPTTKDSYLRYLNKHIVPILGDRILKNILPIDVQELINDFGDTHRSKSCYNLLGILHKMFLDAKDNRLISFNPCESINITQSEGYKYIVYTESQLVSLIKSVSGTIEEIPIVLAGLCGLRRGEIFGLTWNDISFETNEITIRQNAVNVGAKVYVKTPKTNSSNRKIKAPDYVMNVLKKYRGVGYVYPSKDGKAFNGNNYPKKFSDILESAGLPHMRFHDLRHTNATLMLKNGVSDKVAAGRLGHSDINMTKKYQHILESMDSEAATILNNIIK